MQGSHPFLGRVEEGRLGQPLELQSNSQPSPAWSCPDRPRQKMAEVRQLWEWYPRTHGRTPPSSTGRKRQ